MNRIAWMVFRSLPFVPIWFYKICRYGSTKDRHTEQERYDFLRSIVKNVNRSGRVTVEIHGCSNIPDENGFILFPNHQGLFDVLAIIDGCPKPFGVVIKKEAADIILVKQVVRLLGGISIDRENIRESLQVIKTVTEEVKKKRNFLIFPEGTRSRNGNELLPFKGGAFKSAVYAKCPIVPAAVINSYQAFDRHSIRKMTAKVCYLKPLYYEEYKDMKTKEIAQIVSERIREAIKEHSDEEA